MVKTIVTFICGAAAVLIAALVFNVLDLFKNYTPVFNDFIGPGLLASATYSVSLYRKRRDLYLTAAILAVILFIIYIPANTLGYLLNLIFLAGIVGVTMICAFYIYPNVKKIPARVILVLCTYSVFYGIVYLVTVITFMVFNNLAWNFSAFSFWIMIYMTYGAFLGAGLAAGFLAADLITKRMAESL